MPPEIVVSPAALEELKRAATARAEQLGHRLQVFRSAKNDPHCYVSFCNDCRQMVLLNAAGSPHRGSALLGYALETPCAARAAAAPARQLETSR